MDSSKLIDILKCYFTDRAGCSMNLLLFFAVKMHKPKVLMQYIYNLKKTRIWIDMVCVCPSLFIFLFQ